MKYTNPEFPSSALIIIDTQYDFSLPGRPSEPPGTFGVIPNIKRLTGAYRRAGLPIVHDLRKRKRGVEKHRCTYQANN